MNIKKMFSECNSVSFSATSTTRTFVLVIHRMLLLSLYFEEYVALTSTLNSIILEKQQKSKLPLEQQSLKVTAFLYTFLSTFTTLKDFTD